MKLNALKKINLRKFFTFSAAPTGATFFLVKSPADILALTVAYIATLLYLFMFAEIVNELINSASNREKDNRKVGLLFIGKFAVLISGLVFATSILDRMVIVPILNYVLHIFILVLSYKKR